MRFKKFKIQVQKRRFKLLGEINPWVLLASGELEFIDDSKLGKVGDKVHIKGKGDAIIVGRNNVKKAKSAKEAIEKGGTSRFVDDLVEISDDADALKAKFKELSDGDAKKIINGQSEPAWFKNPNISEKAKEAAKKRKDLRKELNTPDGQEAHHAINVSTIGESKVLQDALDSGFAFNTKINGINLDKYSKTLGLKGVHANHPNYDENVLEILRKFENNFKGLPEYSPTHAKAFAEELSGSLISHLDDLCVKKGVKVDDLFKKGSGMGNLDADKVYAEIINKLGSKLP